MAHVLDLTDAQKAILYSPHAPYIGTKVIMRCLAKRAISTASDGTHTFESTYTAVTIDLTNRLKSGNGVRISTSKPIVPNGKGNNSKGANVQLTFINTDEYFATTQDGAILSPDYIQNAFIDIYSTFGGEELLMYSGRVVGRPTEKFGETIFTIRDSMISIVDRPLHFYAVNNQQRLYFENGQIKYTTFSDSTGRLDYYAATAYFDQDGRIKPTFENSDPEKIDILEVSFFGTAQSPISQYKIIFDGPRKYKVVFPTLPPVSGSVDEDFEANGLRINRDAWVIPNDNRFVIDVNDVELEDLTGVEITFYTCFTASGNPIVAVKKLLARALYGDRDGVGVGTAPQIDWDTLDELQNMYEGYTVYISETNKNPSVYDPASTRRPISYKNVIERILEHIGCYLTIDSQGRITVKSPWLLEEQETHTINSDMLQSHEFIGNLTKYEQTKVRYGYDLMNSNYANEYTFSNVEYENFSRPPYPAGAVVRLGGTLYIFNEAYNIGDLFSEKTQVLPVDEYEVSFPYFKNGKHDRRIQAMSCNVVKQVFKQHVQLSAKVLPNHGLPLESGDKVQFTLDWQPKKASMYAEIFSVNKRIGGDVVVKAVEIDEPEHPKELCETVLCTDKIY